MTPEQFEKVKPQLLVEFEKAILAAAKQHPEGFKAWMQALSEGPPDGRS